MGSENITRVKHEKFNAGEPGVHPAPDASITLEQQPNLEKKLINGKEAGLQLRLLMGGNYLRQRTGTEMFDTNGVNAQTVKAKAENLQCTELNQAASVACADYWKGRLGKNSTQEAKDYTWVTDMEKYLRSPDRVTKDVEFYNALGLRPDEQHLRIKLELYCPKENDKRTRIDTNTIITDIILAANESTNPGQADLKVVTPRTAAWIKDHQDQIEAFTNIFGDPQLAKAARFLLEAKVNILNPDTTDTFLMIAKAKINQPPSPDQETMFQKFQTQSSEYLRRRREFEQQEADRIAEELRRHEAQEDQKRQPQLQTSSTDNQSDKTVTAPHDQQRNPEEQIIVDTRNELLRELNLDIPVIDEYKPDLITGEFTKGDYIGIVRSALRLCPTNLSEGEKRAKVVEILTRNYYLRRKELLDRKKLDEIWQSR